VCTHCRRTGRCRHELDAGTAAMRCHQYCPNTATFDDLIGYYRDQWNTEGVPAEATTRGFCRWVAGHAPAQGKQSSD
jgi:hypothetical protein